MKHSIFLLLVSVSVFTLSSCYKNNGPAPQAPKATSQWTRITTLPAENITALEIINNVIYAGSATSRKVYMSTDNGAKWTASAPVSQGKFISALALFQNKLFAGTDQSLFSSSDNGKTWVNQGGSTAEVTSFAILNNNLYCSSYHDGVLLLDDASGKWQNILTSLSPNFTLDRIASKVAVIGNKLFAATAFSFASYDNTQQAWTRKSFFNNYADTAIWAPNYMINLTFNQGSLLSQIYTGAKDQQTIMRSDDLGVTWREDALNLRTDVKIYTIRGLLADSGKYYSLANQDTIAIGTWIQQRDRMAPAGSTWANNEEFLPGILSSVLREYNGTLFLGTDKGLYLKKL